MLIGLSGNYKVGKDTVGAYLVKEHGFERKAFADFLKKSVARTLDIPYHEVDKLKNEDNVYVAVGYKNEPSNKVIVEDPNNPGNFTGQPNHMWSPIREMTFRQFLQYYGTEGHREVFGENIWTDQLLPVEGFYIGRKIVVTDCRFRNEAERIRVLDGKVVKVIRPRQLYEHDTHRSEIQADLGKPDYTLNNNGTIDELFQAVEDMLIKLSEIGISEKERGI